MQERELTIFPEKKNLNTLSEMLTIESKGHKMSQLMRLVLIT